MYNYGKKLIIGIIEDISALNTVRMTGNLDDVAMVNKPVNDCVGNIDAVNRTVKIISRMTVKIDDIHRTSSPRSARAF